MKKIVLKVNPVLFAVVILIIIVIVFSSLFVIYNRSNIVQPIQNNQISNDNSNQNSSNPPAINTNNPPAITSSIDIVNYGFSISNLNLGVGDRVVWTNFDTTSHRVVSDDGEINSTLLLKGESYWHVFSKPGTYHFYIIDKPNFQGNIIIG